MTNEKEEQQRKPENAEPSSEQAPVESPTKSPEQQRAERLVEVDEELEKLGDVPQSSEELKQLSDEREAGFQSKVVELEGGLETDISDESKGLLRARLVDEPNKSIRKKNERRRALLKEKEVLSEELKLIEQHPHADLDQIRDAAEIIVDKEELMNNFSQIARDLNMEDHVDFLMAPFPNKIEFNEEGNLLDRDKLQSVALLFDSEKYQAILDVYKKRGANISYGQGRRPLIDEKNNKAFFNSTPFYSSKEDPDLKRIKFWDKEFIELNSDKMPKIEDVQQWYEGHHELAKQGAYAEAINKIDSLASQLAGREDDSVKGYHLSELRGKLVHLQERLKQDPTKVPVLYHKSEYVMRLSKAEKYPVSLGKDFEPLIDAEKKSSKNLPEQPLENPEIDDSSPSVQTLNEVIYTDFVYFPMHVSLDEMNLPKDLHDDIKKLLPEGTIAPEYKELQDLLEKFEIPRHH